MLSVEDIRDVQFTKNLGGYKTAEVDDFLDKCEETVAALLADKADLTAKMNVLADKLLEYRKDEDSLRTALLDAHKMADQIVKEAKEKAVEVLTEAKSKSENILEDAKASIAAENAELKRAQDEVATFKAHVLRMYREQMALVEALPGQVKTEQPEPKPAAPVEVKAPVAPVAPVAPAAPVTPANPVTAAPAVEQPEEKPSNRYADLKFGESYDIAEDAAEEDGRGRFKRKK